MQNKRIRNNKSNKSASRVLNFTYNNKHIQLIIKSRNKIDITNNKDFLFENININRMSFGNSKLHKIMIFDLPASEYICGRSCEGCYAKKAQNIYKNVRVFRETNYILYTYAKPALKYLICRQLTVYKNKYNTVRVHSSGDFFSQDYIEFWYNIARAFPMYNFYAYTKKYYELDFETNKPNNFNIINSFIEIDGKKYINYGTPEYINELLEKDDSLFVCPATTPATKEFVKCGLNCFYCVSRNKVVFYKH